MCGFSSEGAAKHYVIIVTPERKLKSIFFPLLKKFLPPKQLTQYPAGLPGA